MKTQKAKFESWIDIFWFIYIIRKNKHMRILAEIWRTINE